MNQTFRMSNSNDIDGLCDVNIITPSAHVGLYFFLGCPKMSSLIFEMLMNTILKNQEFAWLEST